SRAQKCTLKPQGSASQGCSASGQGQCVAIESVSWRKYDLLLNRSAMTLVPLSEKYTSRCTPEARRQVESGCLHARTVSRSPAVPLTTSERSASPEGTKSSANADRLRERSALRKLSTFAESARALSIIQRSSLRSRTNPLSAGYRNSSRETRSLGTFKNVLSRSELKSRENAP